MGKSHSTGPAQAETRPHRLRRWLKLTTSHRTPKRRVALSYQWEIPDYARSNTFCLLRETGSSRPRLSECDSLLQGILQGILRGDFAISADSAQNSRIVAGWQGIDQGMQGISS